MQRPQDGKLREGVPVGDSLVNPGKSSAIAPGFNTWTQISTNRPAFLTLELYAETDGTTDAQVNVEVDESGGTTADYADSCISVASVGGSETELKFVYIPAGGQFQINNVSDPVPANSINIIRQIIV